ncbi:MAG: hypothetical protein AB7O66_08180 [Limisphaerales bacterium]
MHRHTHFVLAVALALLAAVPPAARAADLRISDLALPPFGSGSLRLELASFQPVVGVQLDLDYPASQLVLGTPQRGPTLDVQVLKSAEVAPGRRRLLIYSARNQVLVPGVIAEIPVTHVGSASTGTFPIVLTNAIVASPTALAERPLNLFSSELILGGSGPPILSAAAVGPDGRIRFILEGADGETYQIEGSTDLDVWTDIVRVTVAGTQVAVENLPTAGATYRFYRARAVR